MTIADVMRECRNFFEGGYRETAFKISDSGELTPNNTFKGQYIAITGSYLNNGVFKISDGIIEGFGAAESWEGRVYELHPPIDFISLCSEIIAYDKKRPADGLQSESFGNYSYSKASNGGSWQQVFAERLAPYRHMFTEVEI